MASRFGASRTGLVAGLALVVTACDGSLGMPNPDSGAGVDAGAADARILPQGEGFRAFDGKTGAAVTNTALFEAFTNAQVVCLGEHHDDPDHHAFQTEAVFRLAALSIPGHRPHATGFEMFQVPFQPVLDRYAAGQIDEATFIKDSDWVKRWGFPYEDYRPIVQQSVAGGASLLALNAPVEVTKKVGSGGITSLTPDERAQLPAELDFANTAHRTWFAAAIQEGHGTLTGSAFERIYSVQVVWDTTMADVSARWLTAAASGRAHVVIIAGVGHCHDLGIPLRLQQRGVGAVAVRMVADAPVEIDEALRESLSDYIVAIEPGYFARR